MISNLLHTDKSFEAEYLSILLGEDIRKNTHFHFASHIVTTYEYSDC